MNIHKHILLLVICVIRFSCPIFSQNLPPAGYSSSATINYVRKFEVLLPETNSSSVPGYSTQQVRQQTTYIDGLGRPLQNVVKGGAILSDGSSRDLVSPIIYDAYGKEKYRYLPVPGNSAEGNTSLSDGFFKLNAFAQQDQFYKEHFAEQGENWFYSQTEFEKSPLNRVVKLMEPGNNWVGANRGMSNNYFHNTTTDAVRIWNVIEPGSLGNWGGYTSPGIYASGQLYKNITKDEHGKQVVEFKDKQGQVILKKVQLTAGDDTGAGSGHTGWICTYYIYDDFGSLRCVMQPEGVKWLDANGWNLSNATILAEQCFRYEYDQRRRMILKKVPGANEVSMVYDKRDRLVATQDGNGRQGVHTSGNKYWMFTMYDALNRPVMTGEMRTNHTWTQMQAHVNALNNNEIQITPQPYAHSGQLVKVHNPVCGNSTLNSPAGISTWSANTINYYDDYSWVAPIGEFGIYPTMEPGGLDNAEWFYTGSSLNSAPFYIQPVVVDYQVKGMSTGTRVRKPDATWQYDAWQTTVVFYDDKGRVIQTQNTNRLDGYDRTTNQYDFAGRLHRSATWQYAGPPTVLVTTIRTRNEYDALGRLSKSYTRPYYDAETVSTEIAYDALGQVKQKKLGRKRASANSYTNTPLETLAYDYNIRGWLLGVNRAFVTTANTAAPEAGKWFGFDLGYDKTANASGNAYTVAQYNGNISGQSWRSAGDNVARQFRYSYDAANRLMNADFLQNTGGWSKSFNFDSKMGDGNPANPNSAYDLNGNIQKMQQWAWTPASANTPIDDLTYSYQNGGNRLRAVQDPLTSPAGLGDFVNKVNVVDEYGYDPNGNLVTDLNKRLNGSIGSNLTNANAIRYNHLNLPVEIKVRKDDGTEKGTIFYTYDATGVKLQKKTVEKGLTINHNSTNYTSDVTTTTDYITGFVYESKSYSNANLSTLAYTDRQLIVPFAEGRIRPVYNGNAIERYYFDYFLKDHLGNVRMVLTDETKVDDYPTATMEDVHAANEILYYTKINETRADRHQNMPADGSTTPNVKAALLNNSGQRIGPGILLKVQAGDRLELWCRSWWQGSMGGQTNSNQNGIKDGVAALLGNLMPGVSGGKISSGQTGTNGSFFAPAILSFLQGNNPSQTDRPKAYVSWVFLDEQFAYQAGIGSGADVVGTVQQYKMHERSITAGNALLAHKSGYVYIYTSNESSLSVYFDNLKVKHHRGPLLEETHYYPFGLTMAGISSKAAGKLENKFKFNEGTELTNDFDLSLYETPHRGYDPQIGRFWQLDEFGEVFEEWSPFVFSLNNPISLNDPEGLAPNDPLPKEVPKDAPEPTLQNVTVVGIKKTGDVNHGISLYYSMMNKTGGDLSQIVNDHFRNEMYRYQALAEFRNKVNAMTRATDEVAVEIGSYFIPMSWLTKVTKLRHLQKLYALKRGIPLITKAEVAAAKGVEKAFVIGEGMFRVKPAAQSVGAKWYQAWSKNFPTNGRLMTDVELKAALSRNSRWLNSKINQGYKIYDIGPKGLDITSPFYQLERNIIQRTGYPTTPLLGF